MAFFCWKIDYELFRVIGLKYNFCPLQYPATHVEQCSHLTLPHRAPGGPGELLPAEARGH